jgi:glucose-6-phosphate isomerase
MLSAGAGNGGIRPDERHALRDRLFGAHAALDELSRSGAQGFLDLPFATDGAKVAREMAARVRKFDALIVIGIGGSDLAARTVVQALRADDAMPIKFLSAPDPEAVAPLLEDPDLLRRTAISVVSKSGGTLETLSVFFALREALIKAVGREAHKKHIFVTTDPSGGMLHKLAEQEGYAILPHPLNVGGRFSALSVVGLFPAACAGVDPDALLAGAVALEKERRSAGIESDPATFAALHYLALTNRGQDIHVLMPYAARLSTFASWYRQLWAESLGKKKGTKFLGATPVASLGPVDQHSQMQLYAEGPKDKAITFIETERFRADVRVPSAGLPGEAAYLQGRSFAQLIHAERAGTANALARAGRPNGTLVIPSIGPESLGALFQFFMTATAYMGELMGVNAFDQPGVEAGKHEARAILEGKL